MSGPKQGRVTWKLEILVGSPGLSYYARHRFELLLRRLTNHARSYTSFHRASVAGPGSGWTRTQTTSSRTTANACCTGDTAAIRVAFGRSFDSTARASGTADAACGRTASRHPSRDQSRR